MRATTGGVQVMASPIGPAAKTPCVTAMPSKLVEPVGVKSPDAKKTIPLTFTVTTGSAIHLDAGPATGGRGAGTQGPPGPSCEAAVIPSPPDGILSVLTAHTENAPAQATPGPSCAAAKRSPALRFPGSLPDP